MMEATRSKCFPHRRDLLWQICHLYLWACVAGYRCERARLRVLAAACLPAERPGSSETFTMYNIAFIWLLLFIGLPLMFHATLSVLVCVCVHVCLCAGSTFSLRHCDYLSISFYFLQLRLNNFIVHRFTALPLNCRLIRASLSLPLNFQHADTERDDSIY